MEVRLIERYVALEGRRIVEIGCGDGRLTRQLAPLASSVVAIEPDPAKIARARHLAASEGIRNVSFCIGSAEHRRVGGDAFDVALFRCRFDESRSRAWSMPSSEPGNTCCPTACSS
ncbi:methyltransferase domain-containing protein [bacterium]|nr:MAG: methyltransferase domain-containing protein [bacterium]